MPALNRTLTGQAAVSDSRGSFDIVDIETPPPGRGEVRIRLQACGLCHTDYASLNWPMPCGDCFDLRGASGGGEVRAQACRRPLRIRDCGVVCLGAILGAHNPQQVYVTMDQRQSEPLGSVAEELRQWMANSSWPLWSAQGRHASSRFFEVLEFDGKPRPEKLGRVRTQARQVFSFALADELGWSGGAALVEDGLPLLLASGLNNDGIAGRAIDIETGAMLDSVGDLYDTAFCLLAIAQSRTAIGAAVADGMADKLLASVDDVLRYDDDQGYREMLPASKERLQNPHMHFFESLLLYFEKSGRDDVRERANGIYQFVADRFFDEAAGLIRESVSDDAVSTGYDPGHSMEWVWLLGYRARLLNEELPEFALALYERACAAHRSHGWTCLHLDDDNRAIDGSARLWSQTETLKGHLCIAELGEGPIAEAARDSATHCARNILDFWLQSEAPGGWLDHFDADRNLIADAMPASTGYHLYLAIAELARVAGLPDAA